MAHEDKYEYAFFDDKSPVAKLPVINWNDPRAHTPSLPIPNNIHSVRIIAYNLTTAILKIRLQLPGLHRIICSYISSKFLSAKWIIKFTIPTGTPDSQCSVDSFTKIIYSHIKKHYRFCGRLDIPFNNCQLMVPNIRKFEMNDELSWTIWIHTLELVCSIMFKATSTFQALHFEWWPHFWE